MKSEINSEVTANGKVHYKRTGLSQNTLLRQPVHLFVYRYSGRTGRKRHINAISVRVISRIGVDDDPVNVLVFLLGVNGKPARLDLAADDQIRVAPVRLIILKAAVIFDKLYKTRRRSFVHQRFKLRVGFDGELIFGIEAGQQGGDGFSLVGEDEIVIAGFTFFLIQIEAAPFRFIRFFRILGIMKIAVVCKVRIEIGEFGFVVILLIVAVLEDPDAQTVLFVDIRVEFDPLVQFKNAAHVGKRRLSAVEAFRRD